MFPPNAELRNLPHTIERLGNALAVMNADGETCDVVTIISRRQAKRQIAAWSEIYTFHYAAALRRLDATL
jgi:hypothetical protein